MNSRSMRIFRAVLITVFLLVYSYLFYSLTLTTTALQTGLIATWLLLIFAMILSMPLYFWTHPNRGEQKFHLILQITFSRAQGYFSYLFVFVLVRDLIMLAAKLVGREPFGYSLFESLIIIFLPILANLLGRIPLMFGPYIIRTKVRKENLPASLKGFTIAQISDLHIGPGIKQEYLDKVLSRTNSLNADIVVLTGDIVDHLDKWFSKEIESLATLKSKYGIFYIPGNHEYYWGYQAIADKITKLGIPVLNNSNKTLNIAGAKLAICGVADFAAKQFNMPGPDLKLAKVGAESADFKILLAHQPKIADLAAREGFDLQLSGHTHAGQFIPWSLIIGWFQKYPKGLYQIGSMSLYVNQGTGFWGPPDRLGTKPEISLIELE